MQCLNHILCSQDLSDQALLSVYQKEIAKLRRELEENRLKATGGIDPSSVVDKSVLEDLQQKHSELSQEKVNRPNDCSYLMIMCWQSLIASQLQARAAELEQFETEKALMNEKIQVNY